MSVAENLLFGTPNDPAFSPETMAENEYLRKVLHEGGLMQDFLVMGRQLAELMVDLFADVAPESELFEQFSFISAADLPEISRCSEPYIRKRHRGNEPGRPENVALIAL